MHVLNSKLTFEGFHPGKFFKVFRNICHDNFFVRDRIVTNIFNIQDAAAPKRFSHRKSGFACVSGGRVLIKLDQVRKKVVDDCDERQTRFPGATEVFNGATSFVVTVRDTLAPQQQTLLASHAVHLKFLDLQAENESPHQTENHRDVALVDIAGTYQTLQVDFFLLLDEIEGFIDVFKRSNFPWEFLHELQCNVVRNKYWYGMHSLEATGPMLRAYVFEAQTILNALRNTSVFTFLFEDNCTFLGLLGGMTFSPVIDDSR